MFAGGNKTAGKQRRRTHFHRACLLAFAFLLFLAVGCGKRPGPLRIGYIGSLSGKYSALGTNARNGAILALEQFNSKGGIDGRRVELVIRDDQGDPDKALAAAVEMDKMGIRFIIGPFITASGTRIMPFINEKGILTISPTNMGDNLEDRDDYLFKLNPSTKAYGEGIASFLIRKGYRILGSISDTKNDPYCSTFIAGYAIPIENRGLDHVAVVYDGRQRVNYAKTASQALEKGTEAILLCTSALDAALLAQHLKRVNPDVFLMSTPWGISEELLDNGGPAVEGLHFYMAVEYGGKSARTQAFEEMFRSRFGQEISFASIFNYEAMTMLLGALQQAPGGTPDEIKGILLRSPRHRGVQEDFSLDPEGDPVKPFLLHAIRDGQFRRILQE